MTSMLNQMMDTATGYWRSAALSAGVELGVFEALDDAEATAAQLAERLGAAPDHMAALLDALAALQLLDKQADRYRIAPAVRPFLSCSSPQCLLDALRFNHSLYPLWGQLADCVREGKPRLPAGAHQGGDPQSTRRFVLAMHSRARALAPGFLSLIDLQDCRTLLDAGAGPGTFSCLLAEQHPALQVTLFDLPPVLAIAGELLAAHPAQSRIRLQPGDYRRESLPRGFDAVLFSGALHQESPQSAPRIFENIFQALAPGGVAYVVDLMLGEERTRPAFSALFALNMLLSGPAGRVFTQQEVCDLLRRAGFVQPVPAQPASSLYGVVRAQKPAPAA
jgi:SAM-dependent methyltransferase